MPMEPGTPLLHYRLVAKIGQGGMGEVWQATDTTLGREVALKFLPDSLANDPERLARFEREAKALAAVSHPNIAAIYGLHESGGTRFLAMELVPGADLAERLKQGPLPLDEALDVARQIAEGVEAAHEQGIVHRDLKPANVRLTPGGKIKVLDFGLAKSLGPQALSGPGGSAASMTMTSAGTAMGMILGTAAYMSPEQARGKTVDRRTDVWSFGCILYEMLSGKAAFDGETVTDVLAAIVHHDPDWSALPAGARPRVEPLLRRCLVKDPRERLRDLGDVALLVREIASGKGTAEAPAVAAPAAGRSWLPVAAVGAVALLAGLAVGARWLAHRGAPAGRAGARLVEMAPLTDLEGPQNAPSLSPDGKMLLYVSRDGGDEDIFLLRVGGENPINLTQAFSSNDFDPEFSPDGEKIAFVSDREGGGVFVMGATGESPKRFSTEGAHPSWSPDGRKIVFSTERVTNPFSRLTSASLFVVDVATGEKTRIYEGDAVQPVWSPFGGRIAFWAADQGQRDLKTIPAAGGAVTPVTKDIAADWDPFWSPDGKWLYFLSDRGGSPDLWRVAIDEGSGEVRGAPEPITTGVARVMQGSISGDGKRIAVSIDATRGEILRVGFDPVAGRPTADTARLSASANPFTQIAVSQDGRWISYRTTAPRENLYVEQTDGTGRRRLTDDKFRNRGPAWLKDGDWLAFYSNRVGNYGIWLMRQDGTDLRQIVGVPELDFNVPRVSPDGRRVAVSVLASTGLPKLGLMTVDESWFASQPPKLVRPETVADAFFPIGWSPDGTRIAGQSITPQGPVPAIYTLATHRVEEQRDHRGTGFGDWGGGAAWLPDGKRILSWDDVRETAVLWDIATREASDVPGLTGVADLALSADGRTLVLTHTVSEVDIWLLTLE